MKIRLVAFATAATALGAAESDLELSEGARVADLGRLLQRQHADLAAIWDRLAIAVDGELVSPDTQLHDGAEVALLPPVSGGSSAPNAALVEEPIEIERVLQAVSSDACGAVLTFLGTVRDHHQGRRVDRLTYEAYRPMALAALGRIVNELEAAGGGLQIAIVHRIGELGVGEASVAIAVAAPHRQAAFEVTRTALERLKREVPIWKLEHYRDGDSTWREEEPLV
jgi:molybdopterin synthase catalytic subunit